MSVISPTFAKKVYSLNESKDKRNLLKNRVRGIEDSRVLEKEGPWDKGRKTKPIRLERFDCFAALFNLISHLLDHLVIEHGRS